MNREWINHKSIKDRRTPEYKNGINEFLNFAFKGVGSNGKIRCPCYNCLNCIFHDRDVVFTHLIVYGILKDYKIWSLHGEDSENNEVNEDSDGDEDFDGFDETVPLIHDITNVRSINFNEGVAEVEPTEYLRFFSKERKKKSGSWVDKEAEEAYQKLRDLHETQLQCNEVDTLTTQEAFTIVLGHRSGHQRGMGEGPLLFKSANHGGQQNHYSVTNEEITTRIQFEVEEKVANFCLKKEAELRVTLSAEIESKLREELRIEMKKELQRLVKEELASSRESHHPPFGSSISKPVDEKKSIPNDVAPT